MTTYRSNQQRGKPRDAILVTLLDAANSGQVPPRADIEAAVGEVDDAAKHRTRLELAVRQVVAMKKDGRFEDARREARDAARELLARLGDRSAVVDQTTPEEAVTAISKRRGL